jgi:hypothetical protein
MISDDKPSEARQRQTRPLFMMTPKGRRGALAVFWLLGHAFLCAVVIEIDEIHSRARVRCFHRAVSKIAYTREEDVGTSAQ